MSCDEPKCEPQPYEWDEPIPRRVRLVVEYCDDVHAVKPHRRPATLVDIARALGVPVERLECVLQAKPTNTWGHGMYAPHVVQQEAGWANAKLAHVCGLACQADCPWRRT